MKRYCLAVDLKDDEQLIAEYEAFHREVWPEIVDSIKQSGIVGMEIFRLNNRLVMVMETSDDFSFEAKKLADEHNPKVQEWEQLMWKFQQALPGAAAGEKWMVMDRIFNLKDF